MKLVDNNENFRKIGKAIRAGFYPSMFILFWICLLGVNTLSVASSPKNVKGSGLLKYLPKGFTDNLFDLKGEMIRDNNLQNYSHNFTNSHGEHSFMLSDPTNINNSPSPENLRMNSIGELLWKATAETGNLSEWNSGEGGGGNFLMNANRVLFSNASSERAKSGTNSFKLIVDAGTDMASTQLFRYGVDGQPNSNKDAIYTAWYFIPQKIDFHGVSWHNMMQWKVKNTDLRSHPVFTIGLGVLGGKGSGGENFIELRNTAEWFPGGTSYNPAALIRIPIPIGKWFKIEARYIHGSNNNGRIMVWQGDLEGNDTLIYDITGVTTYPSMDRNGLSITQLQWSVNNYTARTIPAVTTIFIDDVAIHLPGSGTETVELYSISIEANPKEGGTIKIGGN